MKKVRDIIRYSHTTDLSVRQIARALGISRTVVAKTLVAFQLSGLEYGAVDQLPDSELVKRLGNEKPPQGGSRYGELIVLFPEMVVELKKKGMTLEWVGFGIGVATWASLPLACSCVGCSALFNSWQDSSPTTVISKTNYEDVIPEVLLHRDRKPRLEGGGRPSCKPPANVHDCVAHRRDQNSKRTESDPAVIKHKHLNCLIRVHEVAEVD